MKTDPTSVNNVVFFSVMETDYSAPLIIICSETWIQQKHLPTSVNNVVLIFSYGDRYHFSDQCDTFLNMDTDYSTTLLYTVKPQSNKTSSKFSEECGTFFSYGDRLLNPFNYCISLVPFYNIYTVYLFALCSAADKYEWYKRKYGILLYLPLKIFSQYWYQSFWFWYRSFGWTDICSGELYIYRTLTYRYRRFLGSGFGSG